MRGRFLGEAKLSRLLAGLLEQGGEVDAFGSRWDQMDPWARLDLLRDAGFDFPQACRVAQMRWEMIADRIRRRIVGVSESHSRVGLAEQEHTLTKHLIDGIFQIDQAMGSLQIVHDGLEAQRELDPDRLVRLELKGYIGTLDVLAGRLEKLKEKIV